VLTALKSSVPTLTVTHVIRPQGSDSLSALTSLDDDVFVMRHDSCRVQVYDAVTFALQRHITVPGLGSYTPGMIACARNKCLYLSNYYKNSVHRVELSGSNAVTKWSVAGNPRGLSLNKARHLVVACRGANKLQEYTTHGSLVREICLQAGLTRPWHAIQLSTSEYVVSQYASPGVVSVVGVDGHSCGQSQAASDVGELVYPTGLTVTKNDNILVADEGNNRILSVNRSTGCVQELTLSVDGGIQRPLVVCLDESRGRLYVAEWGGQHRVLVFDGVRL